MLKERSRISCVFALMQYVGKMKLYLALSVLCQLIFKMLPIAIAITVSYMIGAALFGDMSNIKILFAVVGVLIVADAAFSYIDMLVSHDIAYRIMTKLRDKAYDKIDELAPAALEGEQSGNLVSIILEDIEVLEWFFAHTIPQVIVAFAIFISTVFFMGSFSWLLPAAAIPFAITAIVFLAVSGKKADKQGAGVRGATGVLHSKIVDGVQGLKDIISFNWQTKYFESFFKTNNAFNAASITYTERSANENRIFNVMIEAASLGIKAVVAFLIIRGDLNLLWLIPMFILSSAIFGPIQEALSMSTNYGMIFGAAERLFKLFQIKPKVFDTGTKTVSDIFGASVRNAGSEAEKHITVEFNSVEFTYTADDTNVQNEKVLNALSFSVKTGETLAIVGESGSGKTTVARLIQRFWDVIAGSIKINGIDVRELTIKDLRNIVTVVPQDVYLFNVSVEENLRLAKINATHEEILAAVREAQADLFIQALPDGFNTVIGERGVRLSGGEKQRISIAQAFLKNSPVLILDEASANLDSENEQLINTATNRLKKGRATMVIAHRISTIKNADRIIFIENGKVKGNGAYNDLLMTCPNFARLIGTEYAD